MRYATLKNIAQYINIPGTGKNKNYALALMFLPDILDPDQLETPSDAIYWNSPKNQLYLVRGNYNEHTAIQKKDGLEFAEPSDSFSSRKTTMDLLNAIKNNDMIVYRNGLGVDRTRDNMRRKLDYLIQRTADEKLNAVKASVPALGL